MSLSEPLFKPESLRNLAKDNGPEYAGRSRRALRWCADVIEAADAVVQESNQVRKDDEALIRQLWYLVQSQHDYIMALPADVVASLPAMPGFDGEWADGVKSAATARLEKAP